MVDNTMWQNLHSQLRDGLQKEIHLTRELLSNMNQEEVSKMLDDLGSVHSLLEQQSHLFERLTEMRNQRDEVMEDIEKMVVTQHPSPSLDEILPPAEEITTEILYLRDQLIALTERMHRQHSHNQRITTGGDKYPHFRVPVAQRPKRKASVATYHLKK